MKKIIKTVPLKEVEENYTASVIFYDEDGSQEILEELLKKNREYVVEHRFSPRNENGFTMEDEDGLVIYINKNSTKPTEEIFVHELFHAAYKLSMIMDSEEYGARVYTMLYREFISSLRKK